MGGWAARIHTEKSDGASSGDGGNGTGPHVAHGAATGSQGTKDEGDVVETLQRLLVAFL